VLGGAAAGLGLALGMSNDTITLILIAGLGMIANQVNSTLCAALTGLQLLSRVARWNIVQVYLGGVSALLVLYLGGSVIQYALCINIALFAPIPAHARTLRKHFRANSHIDFHLWSRMLRGGMPYFVLAALLVVYGTIDIPMLQAMVGSEQVGWYALAYRWVSVPAFFAGAVGTAFFPAMSAEGAKITAEFVSLANKALRVAVFVATPAAVGIALIASPFLTLLYGDEFREAIPVMQILAIHIPIVSMDIILGSVAMAADRHRKWVIFSIVATVFNPLLNLVAIPLANRHFENGAIGAASMTVLTEIILMVGGIWIRPKGVLDRWMINTIMRILLASAAMVPAVLLLRHTPLGVQVVAGAAAYVVASLALRTFSLEEARGIVGGLKRGRRGDGGNGDSTGLEPADGSGRP